MKLHGSRISGIVHSERPQGWSNYKIGSFYSEDIYITSLTWDTLYIDSEGSLHLSCWNTFKNKHTSIKLVNFKIESIAVDIWDKRLQRQKNRTA